MKRYIAAAFALLLAQASGSAGAAVAAAKEPPKTPGEIPLSAFAKPVQFSSMKLSPTGERLAAIYTAGLAQYIALTNLPDFKPGRPLEAGTKGSIGDFWWSGPDRLVVAMSTFWGNGEEAQYTGVLGALNGDGTRRLQLDVRDHDEEMATFVQDADTGLPNQILIVAVPYGRELYTRHAKALLLNTVNGNVKPLGTAPMPGLAQFTVDAQGQLRFVSIADGSYYRQKVFSYDAKTLSWKPVPEKIQHSLNWIERISNDGRIWVNANGPEGGDCLMEYLEQEGTLKPLRCAPGGHSIREVIYSKATRLPIATVDGEGLPQITPLDLDPRWKVLINALKKAAGDTVPLITDLSADDRSAVVHMVSDRDPGDFYLFDTKTAHLQFLAPAHDGIDSSLMSERRAIEFKARDGTQIRGYLTLPAGKEPRDLPLVVHPHGGPFDVTDDWYWDAEPQMLASRGYAVLQVNFRGSGGRGDAFITAGFGQWHNLMIDDITDGLRWAIQQGYAAKDRVCIYGVSYGGYAAMMSAVREPDAYRCVVAMSGIYDLKLFRDGRLLSGATDITQSAMGRNYLEEAVGASTEKLIEASPLTYIEKLKAPVMIVHGKQDLRTPYNQAEALRKALETRKLPFEWLIKPTEAHGFAKPENREELYAEMLQFLDTHIGSKAAAATATR